MARPSVSMSLDQLSASATPIAFKFSPLDELIKLRQTECGHDCVTSIMRTVKRTPPACARATIRRIAKEKRSYTQSSLVMSGMSSTKSSRLCNQSLTRGCDAVGPSRRSVRVDMAYACAYTLVRPVHV